MQRRSQLFTVLKIAGVVSILSTTLGIAELSEAAGPPTGMQVQVINTAANPVPTTNINEAAFQPFQATLFPHSSSSNEAADSFTVPAGKRLVIEYYSSQAQDLSGAAAGMVLTTTAGGNFAQYIVYVNATTTDQVDQITRIYADPGSTVTAFAFNVNANSVAGFITISGHLVNVP